MRTTVQKTMSNGVDLEINELNPGFGAEVMNVDISRASDVTREALVEAFHHHGVLLLRNQEMTPDSCESYLRMFGELESHTLQEHCLEGHPYIYILSNKMIDGRPIGAHNDGIGWHTDYSYKEKPVMCTMLYAVEVPEVGSDTIFADCCAAYESLSSERKAQLEKLVLHHSYKFFMENRKYNSRKLSKELELENPDVFHPLIRTHPIDGRKALWVSTGTVKEVVGMPNPDGLDLIDELVEYVTQDKFTYRHKWQVGDILMWDNRCTLHTGTLYDDNKYIRQMYRIWVKGDKPF